MDRALTSDFLSSAFLLSASLAALSSAFCSAACFCSVASEGFSFVFAALVLASSAGLAASVFVSGVLVSETLTGV